MLAFVAAALLSAGCGPPMLSGPPAGYRISLVGFLQTAPLDPPPATTPVVTLIYTLPGSLASSPLDLRPTTNGRLSAWTTIHPLTGPAVLARKGMYVGVFSPGTGKIRYLAAVGDPRDVRGERLDPAGAAVLLREASGTYSVRVPFLKDSIVTGFEVDGSGAVTSVQFYLPFSIPPPSPGGFIFRAVHD